MDSYVSQTCTACKQSLPCKEFRTKKSGKMNKQCNKCLEAVKKSATKMRCTHGKQASKCAECGGSQLCIHDRRKSQCRECEGSSFCEHDKRRNTCVDCGGGSVCTHGKIRRRCVDCKGKGICEHERRTDQCKICNINSHIINTVRQTVKNALKVKKKKHSIDYLGCNIDTFRKHIEEKFKEGMTWKNHGKWHIDHVIPLRYRDPEDDKEVDLDTLIKRLHYTNTQPLWAHENLRKGNRFVG
jgi:hypothetical protein